jgi:8-oxo-dGTP diphosphatase
MKKGEDYTGVAITYLCHDGQGNFLFNKRSQNARDERGTWDTGGGGMEFGDTIEETIKREIAEEYCTDVLSYDFLGYRDVHRVNDSKKTHWIALDFIVLVNREKVKIGEPHKFDEIGWFKIDKVPEPVNSQFPTYLNLHKNKILKY